MGDLPPYLSVVGVAPATLYGLLTSQAEQALNGTYQFVWQRDHALLDAIDRALASAANGITADDATKPRWLDGLITRELRQASTSHLVTRKVPPSSTP